MSKNNKHKARKKESKGVLRFFFFGASILFMPFIMLFLLFERKLNMSYKNKVKELIRTQKEILNGDFGIEIK